MESRAHWEHVYGTKAPDRVSWFAPHLATSLALIGRVAASRSASVIDVGGGASTLVDDLIGSGFSNVSVLDISGVAIDISRSRLGPGGTNVRWHCADVTSADLPANAYDVWHDRAVFHFLTDPEQRRSYVRQVARCLKPSGHVIIGTFGPEGPTKCSGLEVVRYDADSLHNEFGRRFRKVESATEIHRTPFGTTQQFVYCSCALESPSTSALQA